MATTRRKKKDGALAPVNKTTPPKRVQGIILELCDEAIVDDAIARVRQVKPLQREHDGSKADKVLLLAAWMAKYGAKDELAPCDKCGGMVDLTLIDDKKVLPSRCCFCGDGDDAEGGADVVALADHRKAEEAPPVEVVPDDEPIPDDDTPPVVEVVPDDAVPITNASSAKTVKVGEHLAKVAGRIDELVVDTANNFLLIGEQLDVITSEKLWREEVDAKGKPVFKTFKDYAKSRWGMNDETAYRMIRVSKKFSLDEVKQHGVHKLAVASRLPDQMAKKLLGEGASKRRLEAAARGDEAAQNPGPETMTCKIPIKRSKVPLFARPKGKTESEATKPAKRMADDPFGTLELDNGMSLHFVVSQNKKGQMVVTVEPRRLE